ncbi:MAG: NahK/ErcS family hybrid sensor histidine kinase/response regulator, partial [Pseudomonadota bacterium]
NSNASGRSHAWPNSPSVTKLPGIAPLTHGVVWSLGANILVLLTVSLATRQGVAERIQARAFVDSGLGRSSAQPAAPAHDIANADLLALAGRFVGEDHAERAFRDFAGRSGIKAAPSASADPGLIRFTERLLAGAIGAASARVVVATALRKTGMDIGDVVLLLDETSQAIRFNRRLLEATLQNITQGVSVIDSSQRLIGWNSRYEELMEYPPGLLQTGKPIAEIIRYNESRGARPNAATEREIERRLAFMRRGDAYRHESRAVGGKVIDIRGQAMPGGGYVTTYTDITEAKAAEAALRDSERQVRAYTDNAPALLAYVDAGRRFQFVNKAYVRFVGRPRDELVGRSMFEALDEQQLRTRARYLDAAYGGERQNFELEMTNADGESRFMLGTYIPDLDRGSEVVGVYAILQDITERKQAELGLVEAKANLERRVAERTAALHAAVSELEAAKADAEAATASKTRFLAAAAHDLLQPLNATRLFTALLAEGAEAMSNEQRRIVSRVETGLASVEDLLGALLDISRLDSHAPEPRPEPVAVADLFRALNEQFAPSFAEQGLMLKFAPTSLWVETDRALLRRILQNFISNARRYTPGGGVLVGCRRRGDGVALQVVDTGVGIEPQYQRAVFEEFRRLDGADRGAKRGLGLGLAIVERIARLLGHPVAMRSRPGRGSCFEVVAPRAAAGAAGASPGGKAAAAAGSDTLRGLDVLCVDNDPDILDGMAGLLGRWGMRAVVALDPAEARAAVEATLAETGAMPALLLLDYHLDDGVTGLDLAATLRRDCGLTVPTVVVTADYTDDVAQRVEAAGCTILRKPLKPAALRALLTRLVARRAVA